MNELNKKLLAECFDALYSDNDLAKAERLFRRQWNLAARESYKLLESEEDFEITNMGDDFNQSIADEAGSDDEQKFEQLQIAVDELEDKYPVEMTDEVQEKFDELRNKIDEIKLGSETDEDAAVIIEDLKADFEVAGDMTEEIESLFDEISSGLQIEEETEEIDVEDEDESEEDLEESEDMDMDSDMALEESEEDEQAQDDEDIDLDIDFNESEEEDENAATDLEDEKDDEELVLDAKEKAEDLLAILDELEASESEEVADLESDESEDGLKECWEKTKLPRNKLQNEEEGVKKQGMKFGKTKAMKQSKGMAVAKTNSAGTSADKKVKVCKVENRGSKSWSKVPNLKK